MILFKSKQPIALMLSAMLVCSLSAAQNNTTLIKPASSWGLQAFDNLSFKTKLGLGVAGAAVLGAAAYGYDYWQDTKNPRATFARAITKNNWLSKWRIKRVAHRLTSDEYRNEYDRLPENNSLRAYLLQLRRGAFCVPLSTSSESRELLQNQNAIADLRALIASPASADENKIASALELLTQENVEQCKEELQSVYVEIKTRADELNAALRCVSGTFEECSATYEENISKLKNFPIFNTLSTDGLYQCLGWKLDALPTYEQALELIKTKVQELADQESPELKNELRPSKWFERQMGSIFRWPSTKQQYDAWLKGEGAFNQQKQFMDLDQIFNQVTNLTTLSNELKAKMQELGHPLQLAVAGSGQNSSLNPRPHQQSAASSSSNHAASSSTIVGPSHAALINLLRVQGHSIVRLHTEDQFSNEARELLDQVSRLSLDDFYRLLLDCQDLRQPLALCAVTNNNIEQVRKCMFLADCDLAQMPVAGFIPMSSVTRSGKGKGKACSRTMNLLEWYICHEQDCEILSSICEGFDRAGLAIYGLCDLFARQFKFDLLLKLQQIGFFNTKNIDFSAYGLLPIDSLRDYVSLQVKASGLGNEVVEHKLIEKILKAIQMQDSSVAKVYVDELVLAAIRAYAFNSRINHVYGTNVINLTEYMKKQQGDECGFYAADGATKVFNVLGDAQILDKMQALEQLFKTGPDIAALKRHVRENPTVYPTENYNVNTVDNLNLDAVVALMINNYNVRPEDFIVIESMSHFLPEKDLHALAAIDKLNGKNPCAHIFIFKDAPHWTFMVAHKAAEGEPLVLYVGDSKNQNISSEAFNPFETFSDVSDLDLSGFNLQEYQAAQSAEATAQNGPGHSDINSIVRLAYFLSRPQVERDLAVEICGIFDEAQNYYDTGALEESLNRAYTLIDTVEGKGLLHSMHFIMEYVLRPYSPGVGLMEMLRNCIEIAEAFGIDLVKVREYYDKLVAAAANMNEYVDQPVYVSSSRAASSVPVRAASSVSVED